MKESVLLSVSAIAEAFAAGKKLLLCGNGGSCADCDHIAGELLKGFLKRRPIPETLREMLSELYGEEGARIAISLQQGLPSGLAITWTHWQTVLGICRRTAQP